MMTILKGQPVVSRGVRWSSGPSATRNTGGVGLADRKQLIL
jgi:hypothetical protein